MAVNDNNQNHLSKDELFDILNEIDAERQHQYNDTNVHLKEKPSEQRHASPRSHAFKN